MRTIKVFLFIILAGISFVACRSDNGSEDTPKVKNAAFGTWKLTEMGIVENGGYSPSVTLTDCQKKSTMKISQTGDKNVNYKFYADCQTATEVEGNFNSSMNRVVLYTSDRNIALQVKTTGNIMVLDETTDEKYKLRLTFIK